jgi:NADH-quinone oxidoreductase subunit N
VEPDLLWLAVIGVINSVISLYYYVRIVKYMIIDESKAGAPVIQPSFKRFTAMLAGFTALVLIFGLAFNPLAEWAKASAHYLM